MAKQDRLPLWRLLAGWATGIVTVGAAVVLLGIAAALSATSPDVTASTKTLMIIATALDALAFFVFTCSAIFFIRQLQGWRILPAARRKSLLLSNIALLLLVCVFSFVVFNQARNAAGPDLTGSLSPIAMALCIVVLASGLAFLSLAFTPPKPVKDVWRTTDTSGSFSSELKDSPKMKKSDSFSGPSSSRPTTPRSEFPTTPPKKAYLRNSMQGLVKPMTSKSRLISRESMQSIATTRTRDSTGSMRPEDSFDTWEVDVDAHPGDVPRPYPTTRLETIPASRPVSPAKTLQSHLTDDGSDGRQTPTKRAHSPTPHTQRYSDTHSPVSPMDNSHGRHFDMAPSDHFTQRPDDTNALPSPAMMTYDRPTNPSPVFGRNPVRPTLHAQTSFASLAARPTSISSDQARIHPLFRNDSPAPPPCASPNTVVTGSPWGGTVVNTTLLARPPSASSLSAAPGRVVPVSARPALRSTKSAADISPSKRGGIPAVNANMPPMPHPAAYLSRQNSVY